MGRVSVKLLSDGTVSYRGHIEERGESGGCGGARRSAGPGLEIRWRLARSATTPTPATARPATSTPGARFRSLADDTDTTTPVGPLTFHVLAFIVPYERERILERAREGLEAACKCARVGGRPPSLSPAQKVELRRMRREELRPIAIAQLFKVYRKTVGAQEKTEQRM